MGAAAESLVLQTEEQIPEIDARDALPRGPGAQRRPGAAGERGTRPRALQEEREREGGAEQQLA